MKTLEEITASGRIAIDKLDPEGFSGIIQLAHWQGSIIVSWGAGWEHASVAPFWRSYTPTWDDMVFIKNLIWREDEAAIQIHPVKAEYVNNVPNCLHLWRCTYREMILPPSCLVGIRKGQTRAELDREIDEAYRIAEEGAKNIITLKQFKEELAKLKEEKGAQT